MATDFNLMFDIWCGCPVFARTPFEVEAALLASTRPPFCGHDKRAVGSQLSFLRSYSIGCYTRALELEEFEIWPTDFEPFGSERLLPQFHLFV